MGVIARKFFAVIFILPLLFSCTSHYIATWQNYDPDSYITDEGNYTVKNDTIGISHAFNSANGRLLIRMENYSNQPILVNLTKSALTINGKAFNYIDGKATFGGRLNQFGNPEFGSMGVFDGEIAGKTNTLFIPPLAFVESEFTDIRSEKKHLMGEDFDGNWTNNAVFNYPVYSKVVYYEKENSPIHLTSYLNYSVLDSNNQPVKTDIITQNFYLSTFAKLRNQSRQEINHQLASRDDMSSYSISKGYNTGLTIGLLGILALGVMIAPAEE